nr:hypothetical protein [Corynebacterium sp. UBA5992]
MRFDTVVFNVLCLDLHVEHGKSAVDLLLFGFQQVDWDGSRVAGLDKLAAFVDQLASLGFVGVALPTAMSCSWSSC